MFDVYDVYSLERHKIENVKKLKPKKDISCARCASGQRRPDSKFRPQAKKIATRHKILLPLPGPYPVDDAGGGFLH